MPSSDGILPKVQVGNDDGHDAPVLLCLRQALGVVSPLLPPTRQGAVPGTIGLSLNMYAYYNDRHNAGRHWEKSALYSHPPDRGQFLVHGTTGLKVYTVQYIYLKGTVSRDLRTPFLVKKKTLSGLHMSRLKRFHEILRPGSRVLTPTQ